MFIPTDLRKTDYLQAFEQRICTTHTAGKGGNIARLPNLLKDLNV